MASTVLALFAGIWFYGTAGSFLLPYVSSPGVAHLAGFFIVFFGVIVLGVVVSHIVGRFLRVTGLSIFDHLAGAGFGLIRGTLVAVALITGIMAFGSKDQPPPAIVHSRMAPYVVDAARVLVAMAPHELKDGFRKSYADVKTVWEKALEKGIRVAPGGEKKANEREI